MDIRLARTDELDAIQEVYDIARGAMRAAGNDVQWVNGYPSDDLLLGDISRGELYVLAEGSDIFAVFALMAGEDPCYAVIEDGAWLNADPYLTIHRVASDGRARGVMRRIVEFAAAAGSDLRVDTHESNAAMRAALDKLGFAECGLVTMVDGTKRIAYQLTP